MAYYKVDRKYVDGTNKNGVYIAYGAVPIETVRFETDFEMNMMKPPLVYIKYRPGNESDDAIHRTLDATFRAVNYRKFECSAHGFATIIEYIKNSIAFRYPTATFTVIYLNQAETYKNGKRLR